MGLIPTEPGLESSSNKTAWTHPLSPAGLRHAAHAGMKRPIAKPAQKLHTGGLGRRSEAPLSASHPVTGTSSPAETRQTRVHRHRLKTVRHHFIAVMRSEENALHGADWLRRRPSGSSSNRTPRMSQLHPPGKHQQSPGQRRTPCIRDHRLRAASPATPVSPTPRRQLPTQARYPNTYARPD